MNPILFFSVISLLLFIVFNPYLTDRFLMQKPMYVRQISILLLSIISVIVIYLIGKPNFKFHTSTPVHHHTKPPVTSYTRSYYEPYGDSDNESATSDTDSYYEPYSDSNSGYTEASPLISNCPQWPPENNSKCSRCKGPYVGKDFGFAYTADYEMNQVCNTLKADEQNPTFGMDGYPKYGQSGFIGV